MEQHAFEDLKEAANESDRSVIPKVPAVTRFVQRDDKATLTDGTEFSANFTLKR